MLFLNFSTAIVYIVVFVKDTLNNAMMIVDTLITTLYISYYVKIKKLIKWVKLCSKKLKINNPHITANTDDLLFLDPIGLSEATITTTWNSWEACIQISGSLDQNCRGSQTRTGITVDSEANTKTPRSQSQVCYLTYGESLQIRDKGYQRNNKNS